jgi:hypothetical protein
MHRLRELKVPRGGRRYVSNVFFQNELIPGTAPVTRTGFVCGCEAFVSFTEDPDGMDDLLFGEAVCQ